MFASKLDKRTNGGKQSAGTNAVHMPTIMKTKK